DWGVELTSIADREGWQAKYVAEFETMLAAAAGDAKPSGAPPGPVIQWRAPSGELVAAVIQCMLTDSRGWFPLNLPNTGQVADLPADVVVESMCVVDGAGARSRATLTLPTAHAA